jgi:hypothetical protein
MPTPGSSTPTQASDLDDRSSLTNRQAGHSFINLVMPPSCVPPTCHPQKDRGFPLAPRPYVACRTPLQSFPPWRLTYLHPHTRTLKAGSWSSLPYILCTTTVSSQDFVGKVQSKHSENATNTQHNNHYRFEFEYRLFNRTKTTLAGLHIRVTRSRIYRILLVNLYFRFLWVQAGYQGVGKLDQELLLFAVGDSTFAT